MSLAERIVDGLKAVFAARVFQMAANGLIILLLTRVFLTPNEYGLLFYAISVLGIAALFSNLGFAKSGARYLAEYREGDTGQIPHILASTLTYNLVSIALVGATLVVFRAPLAAFLDEPGIAPFLLFGAVYVGFQSLQLFCRLTFQGFNSVRWSAIMDVVANVAHLVFIVGFLLLGFGAIGALLGYAVGYAVAAAVGLTVLYTKFYRTYDRALHVESGLRRRIVEYSVPLTATRGANVLDKKIDAVLVGMLLNPVAVGYYVLGKQISEFVMAPAAALGFTVSPTYGEQKANDDLLRAGRLYETTLEHTLLLYVPAAAGLALVAEPTVEFVFGADYLGAVPVIQIMSVYVVLQAVTNITSDGLDYLGRARARALTKGGTSVANFGLNLALIPTFGVVGAAAATVATHAIYTSVNVYLVHRELSLHVSELARTLVLVAVIAASMSAAVILVLPHVSNVIWLVAVIALGGCVWAALAVVTGLLDVAQIRSTIT